MTPDIGFNYYKGVVVTPKTFNLKPPPIELDGFYTLYATDINVQIPINGAFEVTYKCIPLRWEKVMREETKCIDSRLTAAEARKKATTVDPIKVVFEVNRILELIRRAAVQRKLLLTMPPPDKDIEPAVTAELQKLGYRCITYACDINTVSDGAYYEIAW